MLEGHFCKNATRAYTKVHFLSFDEAQKMREKEGQGQKSSSFWDDFWPYWGSQSALESVQRGPQGREKMCFKKTKEKREKYMIFENHRFY